MKIYGGLREDTGMKRFARPNGLREIAETAISCRGSRPTRKKKKIYQVVGREDVDTHGYMCPCGATIESRTHTVGECENIQAGRRRVRGEDEEIRRM